MTRHEYKQLSAAYYDLLAALDKVAEIMIAAEEDHAAEDKVSTSLEQAEGVDHGDKPV